mmetsp:Transcript_5465/g.11877  ORF Transcript_5465/g.11877 Transcript_5465/m.11877 type:complete len:386 (-) Transcript_5465:656-1813(-)
MSLSIFRTFWPRRDLGWLPCWALVEAFAASDAVALAPSPSVGTLGFLFSFSTVVAADAERGGLLAAAPTGRGGLPPMPPVPAVAPFPILSCLFCTFCFPVAPPIPLFSRLSLTLNCFVFTASPVIEKPLWLKSNDSSSIRLFVGALATCCTLAAASFSSTVGSRSRSCPMPSISESLLMADSSSAPNRLMDPFMLRKVPMRLLTWSTTSSPPSSSLRDLAAAATFRAKVRGDGSNTSPLPSPTGFLASSEPEPPANVVPEVESLSFSSLRSSSIFSFKFSPSPSAGGERGWGVSAIMSMVMLVSFSSFLSLLFTRPASMQQKFSPISNTEVQPLTNPLMVRPKNLPTPSQGLAHMAESNELSVDSYVSCRSLLQLYPRPSAVLQL